MKILGISNPSFSGVTVATKAICTNYMGVPHFQVRQQVGLTVDAILREAPDLLLVGGWSRGYDELLSALKSRRRFPILSVYHSTIFHGSLFNDELYWKQFLDAKERGNTDFIGFVQPQTAKYYQEVKKQKALFVPHFFRPDPNPIRPNDERFRIGILGGLDNPFKNAEGAMEVAQDYARAVHGVQITANHAANERRDWFLEKIIKGCDLALFLSHLECYPNTVQEAWARGVPVIVSPACNGLIEKNPLLTDEQKGKLKQLQLRCATDAVELYHKIAFAHSFAAELSKQVYSIYSDLSVRTEDYVNDLFETIITGYRKQRYNLEFFQAPFKKEWEYAR